MPVALAVVAAALAAGPTGAAARAAAGREIAGLIPGLGSPQFDDRERVMRRLRAIGPVALPAVEAAGRGTPDPEVQARVGELVRQYRAELFGPKRTLTGDGRPLYAAAFSPDGRRVAAGGDGRRVFVWDAGTGRRVHAWPVAQEPCGIVFARDGASAFVGGYGGQVCRLDLATGTVLREFSPPGRAATCYELAVAPDERSVLAIGQDRVDLWDAATGARLVTFPDTAVGLAYGCAFAPDGRRFVVTQAHGPAAVWEAATRKQLLTFGGGDVFGIEFSPDGTRLVGGMLDGTVRVWDAATGKERLSIPAHKGAACRPAFSPDGRRIASPGHDQAVRLWDAATGRLVHTYLGHTDMALRAEFSPDGRLLLTTGRDGTVRLWGVPP